MKKYFAIAVIVGLTGCSAADIFVSGRVGWPPERLPNPPQPRERVPERPPQPPPVARRSFIPPGHLPPPGACKIWTPGTPPGHQPPPESCRDAFYYVKPGQMVVKRDDYNPSVIEVSTAYVYRNTLHFDVEYYSVK